MNFLHCMMYKKVLFLLHHGAPAIEFCIMRAKGKGGGGGGDITLGGGPGLKKISHFGPRLGK